MLLAVQGVKLKQWVLLIVLTVVLSGCAAGPQTKGLVVALQASDDVNPDVASRASPIVVQIIELRSSETFNSLDYGSLTDPTGSALGADRLNSAQLVVAPGQTTLQDLEVSADTTAIGIVAGYRDIDNASWRQAVPIEPGKTDRINVQLGKSRMTVSPES